MPCRRLWPRQVQAICSQKQEKKFWKQRLSLSCVNCNSNFSLLLAFNLFVISRCARWKQGTSTQIIWPKVQKIKKYYTCRKLILKTVCVSSEWEMNVARWALKVNEFWLSSTYSQNKNPHLLTCVWNLKSGDEW